MSADKLEICPFCVDAASQIFPVDEAEANRKYRTFREDYEFWGVREHREVRVDYRGRCTVCGASCEFDTSREIERGDR